MRAWSCAMKLALSSLSSLLWLLWLCMPVLTALFPGTARAHELSMAEMEVRQISTEQFVWHWSASGKQPRSEEHTSELQSLHVIS